MPGILPMKVIKVGNSAQSRIAQACDRCRSKKIRCDGVRPTCSQCAAVGFECRTSDKLSRRAFPRGYTESLEERVRQLEAEVKDLKYLLDEKDEKIDMLSAMHANRASPPAALSALSALNALKQPAEPAALASLASLAAPDRPRRPLADDVFRVRAPPLTLTVDGADSCFMGPSSGTCLMASLKRKLQEAGKSCADLDPETFFHVAGCPPLAAPEPGVPSPLLSKTPPRLFSDRCVNVFFQEWAPLFPVLHKPALLDLYQDYVADPEKLKSNRKLAQLHLVFSIAGLSSPSPDYSQLAACEEHWTEALEALLSESSLQTLQCLVLALIYLTMRGDYGRLQHYRSIAVGLSHRLGLHQSQRSFSFDTLTLETRKKVFWTLYTLDCFSAASMGLPRLLRDDVVETEYPSDMDDEYITEKGFQHAPLGESTRLSSALALFRVSRILAQVLDQLYSTSTNHELSLLKLQSLEKQLEAWHADLAPHLRLEFIQGRPSTDVTGSRSPLLALTFYYIRSLIHRPAAESSLGPKAAPAVLSIAESSKNMVQIIQLLDERSMSFSLCLNKLDLLVACGTTLLYQVIDLKRDSKLMREVGRLVGVVIKALVGAKAPGCLQLARVARLLLSPPDKGTATSVMPAAPARSSRQTPLPWRALKDTFAHTPAGHVTANSDRLADAGRPRVLPPFATGHEVDLAFHTVDNGLGDGDSYRLSLARYSDPTSQATASRWVPNLDYLTLSNTPPQTQHSSPTELVHLQASSVVAGAHTVSAVDENNNHGGEGTTSKAPRGTTSDWEALLGSMDGGLNNVYDAIYGGASLANDWPADAWELADTGAGQASAEGPAVGGAPLPRVPSMSDHESLSSGEEVAPSELGLSVGSAEYHRRFGGRNGARDSFVGAGGPAESFLL